MDVQGPSSPSHGEANLSANYYLKRGGWITFPFITATMAGLTLAAGGWMNNLIVYMIVEFNVKRIDSAQIWNVVNGCTTLFPILGAIVADSFLGSFSVIWISSITSFLGILILFLCSTIDTLRPPPCDQNGPTSLCITPSKFQFSILYLGLTLATIGVGGTRFTLGTMGADQFDDQMLQESFFNWFIFTMYTSSAISATAIVYVQDNVSWGWGFGICAAANVLGLVVFVAGRRFYRRVKPHGSPFMQLARVAVAAFRKRNVVVSIRSENYYHMNEEEGGTLESATTAPTNTFKFLNRAAMKAEGDFKLDGSVAKVWKLCTLQQVEDLKTIIRLVPLWSTGILLSTPLAVQTSFSTLQALTMDRHLGHHFKIPAGSMIVFIFVSAPLTIILLDRFLYLTWEKITGRFPPPLQRVGIGHVLCALSMAVSAVVETNRLNKAHNLDANLIVPMSVFWLVPQLVLAGIGEAFMFPGNTGLFYQEFPDTLKSTATAMVALMIALAYYLSTAVVGLVRRSTGWLPNDINKGRMDNVYWVLFVLGGVNFLYFLVCAWFYKYQDKVDDENKH